MPNNEVLAVTVIAAPKVWDYERAVAIGLKVWGEPGSVIVESDDVLRFVEQVRGLRKRSTARLTYLDTHADDTKGYVEIRHASSGYMLTVDLIRVECLGNEIVGEKAQRKIHLSDEQVSELLADLEYAGGVTQVASATAAIAA